MYFRAILKCRCLSDPLGSEPMFRHGTRKTNVNFASSINGRSRNERSAASIVITKENKKVKTECSLSEHAPHEGTLKSTDKMCGSYV